VLLIANFIFSLRNTSTSRNRPTEFIPDGNQRMLVDIENIQGRISINETVQGSTSEDFIQAPPSPVISVPHYRELEYPHPMPSTVKKFPRQLRSSQSRTSSFHLRWLDRIDRVGMLATVPEGENESVARDISTGHLFDTDISTAFAPHSSTSSGVDEETL